MKEALYNFFWPDITQSALCTYFEYINTSTLQIQMIYLSFNFFIWWYRNIDFIQGDPVQAHTQQEPQLHILWSWVAYGSLLSTPRQQLQLIVGGQPSMVPTQLLTLRHLISVLHHLRLKISTLQLRHLHHHFTTTPSTTNSNCLGPLHRCIAPLSRILEVVGTDLRALKMASQRVAAGKARVVRMMEEREKGGLVSEKKVKRAMEVSFRPLIWSVRLVLG